MQFSDGLADFQQEGRNGTVAGRQFARLQQLHREIRRAIYRAAAWRRRIYLAIRKESRESRRLQLGKQFRFPFKPDLGVFVVTHQHLHGSGSSERPMLCTIDFTIASSSNEGR